MKIDKEKLRQIALLDFHDKHHESVYDCWTEALDKYLTQEGLVIVKVSDENLREASIVPAERKD